MNESFTCVRLTLTSDTEKYQFIESMITGSISMIFQGYAEANNEFLKLYDPNKPTSHIIYLDNYSDNGSIGCSLEH